MLHIMFGQVACHLQRRIEAYEESELVHECSVNSCGGNDRIFKVEDSGCIVHRSGENARVRQYGHVLTRAASIGAPCIPLLSANTFLRHQVGIGTLQSCRHDGLVVIDSDMILGSRLNDLAVVADTRLAFVPLQTVYGTNNRSYIAGFNEVDAVSCVITID